MAKYRPFFDDFKTLDIIFKTAIIVISFNRAIKAEKIWKKLYAIMLISDSK